MLNEYCLASYEQFSAVSYDQHEIWFNENKILYYVISTIKAVNWLYQLSLDNFYN
jgi:hypothetical protein